ncbi:hypothetical protein SEA_ATUIN_72 [Arthrobacter phage Atuin]|nr:hypothetical protein SEA_ATUIN_171 [Arthrobacter phage Atuin]
MISEAMDLGHKAYRDGASRMENPYGMSSDEYLCLAWIRGYNMARTEKALTPEFISSNPLGLAGLRKVGDDRWEMIGPDGAPTGKFVTDDFAQMLRDASSTELDI